MPIFEYSCPDCGHVFEKLVLTRDEGRRECPKCGSNRVDRMFSAFATAGGSSKSSAGACAPSGPS